MVALQLFRRLSSALGRGFREEELKHLCKVKLPIQTYLPSTGGRDGFMGKRVVVVMVGWTQSRQNALSKYAAIYTGFGLPCVAMAPNVSHVWFTRRGNAATQSLLDLLDDSLHQPASLLLHIFSGGGIVAFPQLLSEHDSPNSRLSSKLVPAGVVFDSGPADFSITPGLEAAKLVYQQGGYNFFTYSLVSILGVLTDMAIGSSKRADHRRAFDDAGLLQIPQLYLHSKRDTVCPPETVREVMDSQRAVGREVTSHCWQDSEHVRHFSKHPEEYTKTIADFINTLDVQD